MKEGGGVLRAPLIMYSVVLPPQHCRGLWKDLPHASIMYLAIVFDQGICIVVRKGVGSVGENLGEI